ncbi:hypothetical protein ACFL2Z_00050 [Candidatus Eisenbacteria bacterium]|uniref:HEPN AbiU2-like domain-containing protein n=1 Tax=Eiseniibacteriota bacterium TaxID=2212470 RepID=A0ABV6YMI5_UNCEI
MTIWTDVETINALRRRLGVDIYAFLVSEENSLNYLLDHLRLSGQAKRGGNELKLFDSSPLVLPICKFFEASLYLTCERMGLFDAVHDGTRPSSLRRLFRTKRKEIQSFIQDKMEDPDRARTVLDKLFATIEDYTERNKIVHPGRLLRIEEVENYDAILAKLKELLELLLQNKLLKAE